MAVGRSVVRLSLTLPCLALPWPARSLRVCRPDQRSGWSGCPAPMSSPRLWAWPGPAGPGAALSSPAGTGDCSLRAWLLPCPGSACCRGLAGVTRFFGIKYTRGLRSWVCGQGGCCRQDAGAPRGGACCGYWLGAGIALPCTAVRALGREVAGRGGNRVHPGTGGEPPLVPAAKGGGARVWAITWEDVPGRRGYGGGWAGRRPAPGWAGRRREPGAILPAASRPPGGVLAVIGCGSARCPQVPAWPRPGQGAVKASERKMSVFESG